jgi:predicted small lipoprotein YifL
MFCWARCLLWTTIVLLGAGQMLAACGQKGHLYLPDQPAPAQTAKTPEPPPR